MRMTMWREFKWLIATELALLAFKITEKEASTDMLVAFSSLMKNWRNDARFDTVRKQRT